MFYTVPLGRLSGESYTEAKVNHTPILILSPTSSCLESLALLSRPYIVFLLILV